MKAFIVFLFVIVFLANPLLAEEGKVQEVPRPLKISMGEAVELGGCQYVMFVLPEARQSVLMKEKDELPGSFSLTEIKDGKAYIFSYRLNMRRALDVSSRFSALGDSAVEIDKAAENYARLFHDYEITFSGKGSEFLERLRCVFPGRIFTSPCILEEQICISDFCGSIPDLVIELCKEKGWHLSFRKGDMLIWKK